MVCRFAKKINKSSLYALAATRDGLILCKAVFDTLQVYQEGHSILHGIFLPPSCEGTDQTTQLFENVIKNPTPPKDENLEPRRLSECEMDYYTNYNKTDKILWENKGGVYYSTRGERNKINSEISWELPTFGIGYITYKRNDLQKDYRALPHRKDFADDYGYDQIGTKKTVEAMMRIAREWYALHPERKLQIGDMSRPGGINTPDHGGHDDGNIVDVRPIRNDSQIGDAANLDYNSSSYHLDYTKEFIRLVKKLYPNIFIRFNDGRIAGKGEFTYVHKDSVGKVHNDHLHLEFR